MPTQELRFDFNQFAKLKEAKRNIAQPAYDKRFYPANLDFDLYGRVLEAKFIELHGGKERVHLSYSPPQEGKPTKSIWSFIKWLAA